MDNLIADGEVADAIVVTKDNIYFNFEKGDSLKNLTECIMLHIEKNYSVSANPQDKVLAGLSSELQLQFKQCSIVMKHLAIMVYFHRVVH